MKIGTLAKKTGIPAKTIRYYESIGLLPEPPRHDNGYRSYGDTEMNILGFIGRARALGFPLKDVQALLDLWQNRERASADVKALAENHMAEIDERIRQLEAMRETLGQLVHQCHGDDRPDCPILNGLAETATGRACHSTTDTSNKKGDKDVQLSGKGDDLHGVRQIGDQRPARGAA